MTRLAVISDMHGNAVALEAALGDARSRGAGAFVCLGDAIQGGPQPAQTARMLRGLACPVVMGNADAFVLGEPVSDEGADAERARVLDEVAAWTRSQLSGEDLGFMRAFAPTVDVPLPGGRSLLCFHGSPRSFDDVILPSTPDAEARALLEPFEPDGSRFMAGGHTHVQNLRHFGRAFYFNPGSVGFAYRHGQDAARFRADPWAEYAILECDPDRLSLEFHRVPFDADALVRAYHDSGRPHAEAAVAQYLPPS